MATKTPRRRPRTLKLRDGIEIPIREAKTEDPEEREAALAKIGRSIKTDVIVDRSFYRNGR
jgi:hypothetical protein